MWSKEVLGVVPGLTLVYEDVEGLCRPWIQVSASGVFAVQYTVAADVISVPQRTRNIPAFYLLYRAVFLNFYRH